VSDQEYLNNNYNLKLAQINVDISQYDLNNLPANASSYDKRIAEIIHQKNILTLQDSQDTLIEAHKTTKNSIETLYKNLKNLEERMSLTQSTYKDTMDRFNKGLVSELELNTANINYLTTQKNYYESVRSYIKAYINYVIDTGRSLEEVGL
jgi:outer membrane protein TolC